MQLERKIPVCSLFFLLLVPPAPSAAHRDTFQPLMPRPEGLHGRLLQFQRFHLHGPAPGGLPFCPRPRRSVPPVALPRRRCRRPSAISRPPTARECPGSAGNASPGKWKPKLITGCGSGRRSGRDSRCLGTRSWETLTPAVQRVSCWASVCPRLSAPCGAAAARWEVRAKQKAGGGMPGSSMWRMRPLTLLFTSESDPPVSILVGSQGIYSAAQLSPN